MLRNLPRLKLLFVLSSVAILAIAGYLWHRTTTIPNVDHFPPLSSGTNLGKQACQNFDRVRLKVSMSKQRETAILNAEDINTLFACGLYVGLGEQMGSVLQTNVRLSRKDWAGVKDNSVVRAEVIVDLAKVPATPKEDRLGTYGKTVLSTIIFKLRKIPILGSQKLFFSIEGSPTVRERNFIFYDQPQIQIGQWQFTFQQISKLLNIHPPFLQEFLDNEYGSLPMDPYSISVRKNSLDLQLNGSKTAW